MKRIYLVTGANGHLGNTLLRILSAAGQSARGLLLPGSTPCDQLKHVEYVYGDLRDPQSLLPLFAHLDGYETILIHTAGIVSIENQLTKQMFQVNVLGTKNIIALAIKYQVTRLVYVSSVHAIPEQNSPHLLHEIDHFSADKVEGGYAKSKAMATQLILHAVKEKNLNAVIVHPSGILGPYDESGNHLVQLVQDYLSGKLPACVKGGYDFVDVRDVAKGCLAAANLGKKGQCYILSNRHYDIKDILSMIRFISGGKKLLTLPIWLARVSIPFLEFHAKRKHKRPLFTKYSLYTLNSNDHFSHEKATKELNYHPRDLYLTIRDTVTWLTRKKIAH